MESDDGTYDVMIINTQSSLHLLNVEFGQAFSKAAWTHFDFFYLCTCACMSPFVPNFPFNPPYPLNAGMFWMSFEDMVKNFYSVNVCMVRHKDYHPCPWIEHRSR